MTDYISLEEMANELTRAGWTAKTSAIWRAPNGALFLGPAGAWRRMRRCKSTQDQIDTENGRVLLNSRSMKVRLDIEQIFIDCASWNDNARMAGEAPIDCDPDGLLRRTADALDRTLAAEARR